MSTGDTRLSNRYYLGSMTTPAKIGAVSAWPHPGVTAVELWDVVVETREARATLFARRDEPTFYASLATAVLALRRGEAAREGRAPHAPLAWDSVALVGGALDEARARDAFDAARIQLDVVSADPFFAASHGREALSEQSKWYADAVVVDVGQTAVKACGPSGRIRRARPGPPFDAAAASPAETSAARAELVEEVAAVVLEACRDRSPSFLLLGVPCEVTPRDGTVDLGASTYPIAGDALPLMRAVLARAGHPAVGSAVANDAVLAAWALGIRSPSRARTRLVLTVGLGVGAAVVDRAPPAS